MKSALDLASIAFSTVALLLSFWGAYISYKTLDITVFQAKRSSISQDCFEVQKALLSYLENIRLYNALLDFDQEDKESLSAATASTRLAIMSDNRENAKIVQLFKWKNPKFETKILNELRQNSIFAAFKFSSESDGQPYDKEMINEFESDLNSFALKCSEATL